MSIGAKRPHPVSVYRHEGMGPTRGATPGQVLTSLDSPRAIWRVMVAKWVCITHLKAN